MPTEVFMNLNTLKKDKIINVIISEFAQYGYQKGSTLRIVSNCGISKGSLFNYFHTKEEMYLYILKIISDEYLEKFNQLLPSLSTDLFERIFEYSSCEFSWYRQNPEKFKILFDAFENTTMPLREKIKNEYSNKSQELFSSILNINEKKYCPQVRFEIQNILKWFIDGFNKEFINTIDEKYDYGTKLSSLSENYSIQLRKYLKILEKGIEGYEELY